ncbi:alpha/beta hydrolase family protein,tetratricopeptide repeat protein [Thiorhodovibrio frisius]|uniref:protein O-GlcNAc transferase n=2 Tax=Thiorhodovibrio frisius TaxID=631362 RepID=H8Z7A2_9GAMM|nr:alpha/beta hydrolase family protein,tetratricopeptide repeat protein [Thiorhodovibrio frisius]WPL20203.1 TPR repeat-containing protein YrrB [Thiorhodovibrio frisius]
MDAALQQTRLLQVGQAGAPPLLLIPGALTVAQGLLPVARVLAQRYRVGVLDVSVPIGGGECFSLQQAATLAANAVRHLASEGEQTLVVGESAGGLIGLELARMHPALVAGLVLADPPLAPAKLWHVRSAMQQAVQQAQAQGRIEAARFFAAYAQTLFGYALADGQSDREILYHPTLSECPVLTLVLTGDEPLWPARQSERVPCLLDAQDLWMLGQLDAPRLRVKRLAQCDHIFLRRHPEACLRLLAGWQADMRAQQPQRTENSSSASAQRFADDARYQQAFQAHQNGDLQAAEAGYRNLLAQHPAHAEALHSLGFVLYQRGDPAGAEALIRRAIRNNDQVPAYHCHHGVMLQALLRLEEALQAYDQALALKPDYAEAHSNRGTALDDLGRLEEALQAYDQALALKPDYAEAHFNRGNAVKDLGRLEEALQAYDQALALKPDYAKAHSNRGTALKYLGRLEDALQAYDQALALKPDFADAHSNRGNALKDLGRLEDALQSYEQALRIAPQHPGTHSNRLLTLHYREDRADGAILSAARAFGRRFDRSNAVVRHANRPDPARRLRIGYVSGDFRQHPVAFFLEPVLAQHRAEEVELIGFTTNARRDALSARLQAYLAGWHSLVGLEDADAAALIRAQGIDILVDLSGHTGHNRLPVFAYRPAPVQLSWLGYVGTTGLTTMDYVLADGWRIVMWCHRERSSCSPSRCGDCRTAISAFPCPITRRPSPRAPPSPTSSCLAASATRPSSRRAPSRSGRGCWPPTPRPACGSSTAAWMIPCNSATCARASPLPALPATWRRLIGRCGGVGVISNPIPPPPPVSG